MSFPAELKVRKGWRDGLNWNSSLCARPPSARNPQAIPLLTPTWRIQASCLLRLASLTPPPPAKLKEAGTQMETRTRLAGFLHTSTPGHMRSTSPVSSGPQSPLPQKARQMWARPLLLHLPLPKHTLGLVSLFWRPKKKKICGLFFCCFCRSLMTKEE